MKIGSEKKPILDCCCGGRQFWFDKDNELAVFVDKRIMPEQIIWQSADGSKVRKFKVEPDIVADFQHLPFEDNSFYHVVFDPPHLTRAGDTSWLAAKYGRLPKDWKDMLRNGFRECVRVLKPYGTLIFKWNEENIPLREVLDLCELNPLYGHRGGKGGKTHWIAFMKTPDNTQD